MKILKFPRILFASITMLALVVSAQSSAKPGDGRIRDVWCNNGIAKAVITIKGTKIKRKVKSDSKGKFEVHLPAGTYQRTVEKDGFKRYIVNDVKVTVDADSTINVDMEYGYATDDPRKPPPCRTEEPQAANLFFRAPR